MKLVDANVLLYAVNDDSPQHDESRRWLDASLSGADTVAFAWQALLAFVRIATSRRVFDAPLTADEALHQVDAWLRAPSAVVLDPGPEHARALRQIMAELPARPDLVNDAHLAALALAHRATVVTYDGDFQRFADVRSARPDQLLAD